MWVDIGGSDRLLYAIAYSGPHRNVITALLNINNRVAEIVKPNPFSFVWKFLKRNVLVNMSRIPIKEAADEAVSSSSLGTSD